MRRIIWGLGGLGALMGLLWMLGPRPAVEEPAGRPVLPGDLDAYLAAAEARFDDLRPGVEKAIVWADPATRSRTPLAVVYLHGFSATREETRPLCDTLAARLGANLFYTRLTGHGRTGEALAAATASDWLRDALEALAIGQRLGERVDARGHLHRRHARHLAGGPLPRGAGGGDPDLTQLRAEGSAYRNLPLALG
ncbi:MAG: hypothetical protein KatS3mg042_1413 [Rhodothermaceae bacterium]|nr:MAG: hypothetical protein KatS3mg042_1413 [Rhodothermaceae bacterium]